MLICAHYNRMNAYWKKNLGMRKKTCLDDVYLKDDMFKMVI